MTTLTFYDRADLLGILAFAMIGVLASASGVLAPGAGEAALDLAFVVFGYMTVRALVAPGAPEPGREHHDDGSDDPAALRQPSPEIFRAGLLSSLARWSYPALVLTCLVSLVTSPVLVSPPEVEALAVTAVAAVAASQNLLDVASGGMASATALGHGWAISLAAQWSVLAVVLVAGLRRGDGNGLLLAVLGGLALASTAASFVLPAGAHVTLLRLFPFALGGLMVGLDRLQWQHTLMAHLSREALVITGIAMIGAAVVFDSTGASPWLRGIDGIGAAFGTAAILFARGAPTLGHVLTNPPTRWLGASAFTIYVVHGPLFAFLPPALFEGSGGAGILVRALASIVLGLGVSQLGAAVFGARAGSTGRSDQVWAWVFAGAFAVAALASAFLCADGSVSLPGNE
ncbi:MAG: hypothetical protein AAF253_01335 [Pseudomonadota bacterium]